MEISKHLKYWEDNILSEVHQIDIAIAYNGNIKALKVLRRQSLSEVQQIDAAIAYNGNIKALKVLRRQSSFRGTTNRCSKCLQWKYQST
jgi:ADP-dependent phosphofructokinase/glucokinase